MLSGTDNHIEKRFLILFCIISNVALNSMYSWPTIFGIATATFGALVAEPISADV